MKSPVALLPDAMKALLALDNAATHQVADAWARCSRHIGLPPSVIA
jgi:hypothetical protein